MGCYTDTVAGRFDMPVFFLFGYFILGGDFNVAVNNYHLLHPLGNTLVYEKVFKQAGCRLA